MRGDRIRELREKSGLSQQDLADRTAISHKQLWRYENEESIPSADVLARLAREFDVTMEYLIGLSDDPHGYTTIADLSHQEQALLEAYRQVDLERILRIVLEARSRPSE